MPFVGYTASRGSLNLMAAIVAGAIGSTLGSVSVYIVAPLVNREKVTRFLEKHGKWLGITTRKIDRAGKLFDTHVRRTVFLGDSCPVFARQ
ncbi:hypothetical protein H7097_03405 [Aeromicrobium sp.]|nr:hypothetical protein [Candidatus Saccharibacteria bacterium]